MKERAGGGSCHFAGAGSFARAGPLPTLSLSELRSGGEEVSA
jgi:hypothetical protein